MKKIILFNPSISSLNCGDHIIYDSAGYYIKQLFPQAFYVEVSTHLPVSNKYMKLISNTDYKFVCGTNLLKADMLFGFRQWDISYNNIKHMKPVILLGCGWWQYQKRIDIYSKMVLRNMLDSQYIHSVRDNYTLEKLNSIGIRNVINTGCPTMWKLDDEHCKQISTKKSTNVITTLTDYAPDIVRDRELLNMLIKNYNDVYVWLQGYNDYEYFKQLNIDKNIKIVPPTLSAFDNILAQDDIEYVGTRLHGGIRAIQKKKRAVIVAVDNRAIEKKKDFNLNVVKREDIADLESYIQSCFETKINIKKDNINNYLKQFK